MPSTCWWPRVVCIPSWRVCDAVPHAAAVIARRNWFLAQLGLVRYVPRDQLSATQAVEAAHAAAGRSTESKADDSIAGSLAEREVAPGRTASQPLPGTAMPRDPVAEVTARRAVTPRVVLDDTRPSPATVSSPVVDNTDAEPFLCRVGFWHPQSSPVAVLSAMPPGQRPTPVQLTMLANLLKAIGALGQGLPSVDLIDWPPSQGPGLQQGASLSAARDFLSVFLHARWRRQGFETLLVMGEVAARICGDNVAFTVGGRVDFSWGASGIMTHSLHDMEKTPALKADTWQAIRFLAT